ncbi:MAG: SH3 domain-containing protein [Bacteroidota bacterium]
MKKFLFLLLIISLNQAFSQNLGYQVTAKSGLVLRDSPGLNSNRIGKIPYLAHVDIIERSPQKEVIRDEGKKIEAHWVKIRYTQEPDLGINIGYVFEGFLAEQTKPSFQFAQIDTAKLYKLAIENKVLEYTGYLYLKTNYKEIGPKKARKYVEWNKEEACAYAHDFEQGISYQLEQCGEGGASELISFPKMGLKEAQRFIETLFHTKENSWTSPFSYEAEGAGCYYEIKQTATKTIIDIYCGC